MPTVLITGAARGIGKSITTRMADAGWDVVAGVRSDEDAASITAVDPRRITSVLLDVTNPDHLGALPAALPARVDAVVNNAGISVGGPLETVSVEDWRKQLDVNLIGPMAVTRAVLPKLRETTGRVVFISSVSGRMSLPLVGPYCASKFALEAAADALRLEVQAWGIDVVVVEPAQTDTDMARSAGATLDEVEAALSPEHRALYAEHVAAMKKLVVSMMKKPVPADKVAAVVAEALTARRPRARYVVGFVPRLQVALMTNLPMPLRDRLVLSLSGLPRRR